MMQAFNNISSSQVDSVIINSSLSVIDKSKSHIYSDRIWYLKLYHFTLFMHILIQLVDLVWILHKVRDTAMVSLISGLLEHFENIWMKME
jgi:hypothetical protein